ncbi:hypothetical protein HaLaN_18649 [Haematococcus lacustris]|uniref:Uncharacterized protein n=1 Tax=Haematococcus lacustris TaxID=44745 RepID=A0A699ZJW7_HAELA|nr:hypothetical protein HaLaN_18649 [Haematococcus lacustris]
MPPRKRPSSAEPEPHPIESPRKQAQVLAPLLANNARSEGLNGRTSADRCALAPALYAPALFVSPHCVLSCQSANCAWPQVIKVPGGAVLRGCPVVAPGKPPQAPRSSQAAPQPAASEPGPSTPLPAKRSKRTKAEPEAAEPTKGKGRAAKAKPAPQPGRLYGAQDRTLEQFFKKGLQCRAEHAARWGEQVAAAGAVLVARAGPAASQGQGVPWPGVQASARQATARQGRAYCGTVVCAPPHLELSSAYISV